MLVRDM
jgi:hypothetical protein